MTYSRTIMILDCTGTLLIALKTLKRVSKQWTFCAAVSTLNSQSKKIHKITLAITNSSGPNKEIMETIVCFQAEKIDAQDARTYTIQNAIDYIQKEN